MHEENRSFKRQEEVRTTAYEMLNEFSKSDSAQIGGRNRRIVTAFNCYGTWSSVGEKKNYNQLNIRFSFFLFSMFRDFFFIFARFFFFDKTNKFIRYTHICFAFLGLFYF